MKVVLINSKADIGDALRRAGVQRLLGDHEYAVLDRTAPWSVYGLPSALRLIPGAVKTIGKMHRSVSARTVISGADLVVNCGGPLFFHGVSRSAWQRPLWDDALGRKNRPPVLNLSAGSCFPWTERRPTELTTHDESALRRIFRRSDVVTASDREAARMAKYFGMKAALLPDVAVHAAGGETAEGDSATLIVNVAPGAREWLQAMDEVIARRSRTDRILMLCHTRSELELANTRWAEHQAVLPREMDEYLDVARRGRVALVNRLDAALAFAGLGIPTLVIGSDTRLLAAQLAGQETAYQDDVTARGMLTSLDLLDIEYEVQRKRLVRLEERSFGELTEAIRDSMLDHDVLA